VALTDPRTAPFAEALRDAAAAPDAGKTPEDRRLAAIGGALITSVLADDFASFGSVIDPVSIHDLGAPSPRRTGMLAAPQGRTPTRAELDEALGLLSDQPNWERALSAGDPAIARVVVALEALSRGGPERPDHIGPHHLHHPHHRGHLALQLLHASVQLPVPPGRPSPAPAQARRVRPQLADLALQRLDPGAAGIGPARASRSLRPAPPRRPAPRRPRSARSAPRACSRHLPAL
jgi:hypothetical protein